MSRNAKLLFKIEETEKWYSTQLLPDKPRLFSGEDNEMTTDRIWKRLAFLRTIKARIEGGRFIPEHLLHRIERMHWFGPVSWPLTRIKRRADFIAKKKKVAILEKAS